MVATTGYAATHCTDIFYLFSLNIPIVSAAGRKYPSTAALMAPTALAAENILNSNSTFLEKKEYKSKVILSDIQKDILIGTILGAILVLKKEVVLIMLCR